MVVKDQTILRFLNAGLINVGGDDTKLLKLRETAADLASALKTTPFKAIPFALIAFDPVAPADDPVIQEALSALQTRWATYANVFSGTPVALLRAVLLDALVQAASADDRIGVAFVASARNVLPFTEAGNEREIWADVVANIEQHLDARAEAEWATPETIEVSAMTFKPPTAIKVTASPVSINKDVLVKQFEAAAGPTNAQGQPTGGNPNYPSPNQNVHQQWGSQFGTRLADSLAELIGAISKASEINPIDLSEPLNGLAQTVSDHVDRTLKAVSDATVGLQRRTNLIWWKETLYSPSARITYREMPSFTAAALMAFDLYRQVPTFSPASVAAFLHEAVLTLPSLDRGEESRPIRDLLTEASGSDALRPLRQAAAEVVAEPIGRGPLLGIIGHGAGRSALDDRTFRDLVGVPAATALTVPEWAKWVFRELQAARASQEAVEAGNRGQNT